MNAVQVYPVGSRELTIRTTLTPDGAESLMRERDRVFLLTEVSWDDSGAATLRFVPSNGVAEIVEAVEPMDQPAHA